MKKIFREKLDTITRNKLKFTAAATVIVLLALLILDIKRKIDLDDVIVEAHGLLFDLILFGIIISLYEGRQKKREGLKDKARRIELTIERYLEEIDDLKHWQSEEAKYRIIGNIKRLNRHNYTNIDISGCYLDGATMDRLTINCKESFENPTSQNIRWNLCQVRGVAFYSNSEITAQRSIFEFQDVKHIELGLDLLSTQIFDSTFLNVTFRDSNLEGLPVDYQFITDTWKTDNESVGLYTTKIGEKTILPTLFSNCKLVKSIIINSTFTFVEFNKVKFINCEFDQVKFINCSFVNCNFISKTNQRALLGDTSEISADTLFNTTDPKQLQ